VPADNEVQLMVPQMLLLMIPAAVLLMLMIMQLLQERETLQYAVLM
jgi:hypothetical protein